MAASSYYSAVQKAYIAYYGRPADIGGLTYWADRLNAAGGNLSAIIQAFGTSAEAQDLYGDMSYAAAVNTIYNQIFGRDADTTGLNWYVQRLGNGTFTLVDVAQRIIDGATGSDATIVANKLVAAQSFTDAFDTTAEIVAYDGVNANEIARDWLNDVGATSASLTAAQADLSDAITQMIRTGIQGSEHDLTPGIDHLVGTNDNDTFNAFTTDPATGATASTLSLYDTIDGGRGDFDTLNIYSLQGANDVQHGSTTNVEVINFYGYDVEGVDGFEVWKDLSDAQLKLYVGQEILGEDWYTEGNDLANFMANYYENDGSDAVDISYAVDVLNDYLGEDYVWAGEDGFWGGQITSRQVELANEVRDQMAEVITDAFNSSLQTTYEFSLSQGIAWSEGFESYYIDGEGYGEEFISEASLNLALNAALAAANEYVNELQDGEDSAWMTMFNVIDDLNPLQLYADQGGDYGIDASKFIGATEINLVGNWADIEHITTAAVKISDVFVGEDGPFDNNNYGIDLSYDDLSSGVTVANLTLENVYNEDSVTIIGDDAMELDHAGDTFNVTLSDTYIDDDLEAEGFELIDITLIGENYIGDQIDSYDDITGQQVVNIHMNADSETFIDGVDFNDSANVEDATQTLINIAGSGSLTLLAVDDEGATVINGAAATGDLTIGRYDDWENYEDYGIYDNVLSVTTGSGDDVVILSTWNTTTDVTTNAGDDYVYVDGYDYENDYSGTVSLGAGNDVLELGYGMTEITADGGAGVDELIITLDYFDSEADYSGQISGFEKLVIADYEGLFESEGFESNAWYLDVANFDNIQYVALDFQTENTEDGFITIDGLASGATIEFRSDFEEDFEGVWIDQTDSSYANTVLNIALYSDSDVEYAEVYAADVERLNFILDDTDGTGNELEIYFADADGVSNLTTVTAAGDGSLDFATDSNIISSFNASGMTAADSYVNWTLGSDQVALTYTGGAADDFLYGAESDSAITFTGNAGDDYVDASSVADRLTMGAGNDTAYGNDGNDVIDGGDGDDSLYGGSGNDTLTGGAGDDYLVGNSGVDVLTGGAGEDWFNIDLSSGVNTDTITDFLSGTDVIELNVEGDFSYVGEVATFGLVEAALIDATTTNAAVLDSSTGFLYVDLTGDGSIDLTVKLTGVSDLSSSDFYAD